MERIMDGEFMFKCVLCKITTTVDGGWRVSFDLPNSEKEAIVQLAELRDRAIEVQISAAG